MAPVITNTSQSHFVIFYGIAMLIVFAIYLGLKIVCKYFENQYKAKEFEIKLAMTEAQAKSTSVKEFDTLINTLEYITNFYCANEGVYLNKSQMTEEALYDTIANTTAEVSTNVISNLSDEFKRQLQIYVTMDWVEYYVRKNALIKLTTLMESPRSWK